MNAERKKALLLMSITFIAGIVIGVLATGIFARQFYHGSEGKPGRKEMKDGRRGSFSGKIFKVVKADSGQRLLMKPIVDQVIARIDKLEDESNLHAYAAMDSLKIKFRPILDEEQMERLEKFLVVKRRAHEKEEKREHDRDHGRH